MFYVSLNILSVVLFTREDNKEAKLRLQASVETDASLKEALEDSKGCV